MKTITITLFLLLITVGCTKGGPTIIQYKEAKDLIEKGAILIDVRTELEYDQGHIEGAVLIPSVEIDQIKYDKNKKIILYCRSGSRSKTASDILDKLGYKHIYNLGSKDNWKEELVQ